MTDDYSQTQRLESMLKKVGFDVLTSGAEAGMAEALLGFNPDIIIATGSSSKLNPLSVGIRLKENRQYTGGVILGFGPGFRMTPQDLLRIRMDRMLEAPFQAELLLRNICEVLQLDAAHYLEKLGKLQMAEATPDESQFVKGGQAKASELVRVKSTEPRPSGFQSSLSTEERAARFKKAASEVPFPVNHTTLERTAIREKWNSVQKEWNDDELEEQNGLKRAFVDALFQDASSQSDENVKTQSGAKKVSKKPE